MSVLFKRKTTLRVQNPSNNDGCGTVPEVTCSNTLVNANRIVNPVDEGELQMKRKALKEISEFINGKMGNFLGIIRGEDPVIKELRVYVDALATAVEDVKFCTGEDTTVVHGVYSELKVLLEPFDSSLRNLKHSVITEHFTDVLNWVLVSGPKLNDFLKRYARSQSQKSGKMVVSESSSTSGVEQGGLEISGNTYYFYAKNMIGERNNKGNKGKKNKSKKDVM